MKSVVLTLGPRGAGKTTFCKEVVRARPEVVLVERDAMLVELFRSPLLNPYDGSHETCFQEVMRRVGNLLRQESVAIILDTWTEVPENRRRLIQRLRELGADRVVGWNFVTPEDDVVRQFLAREATPLSPWRYVKAETVLRECRRYREHPIDLDQGFDHLVEIDPKQPLLFLAGVDFF